MKQKVWQSLTTIFLATTFIACGGGGGSNPTTTPDTNTTTSSYVVKKTGQTKSYDENGTEVTDNSLRDDGYYQKGQTPNYTRASGIVTDELTGLMWQDDYSDNNDTVIAKPWLTPANYTICDANTSASECYDTSGDTAATYCSDLILGGYTDWRLPTVEELEGILNYGRSYPAIDTTYFQNTSSHHYWSSSTYENFKVYAGVVGFGDGDMSYYVMGYNYYVRCVREGQ